MKVSIITPCYNSVSTIEETLDSVEVQEYPFIEHIIIDSASHDGTIHLLDDYKEHIDELVSEEDEGIYNAINKGVKKASGDIIGVLNSDDVYFSNSVINRVVEEFENNEVSAVYGDLKYIDDDGKTLRYWKSGAFDPSKFDKGWMPPHPTFFVKSELYEEYGLYDEQFDIAADYELMLRFLYKNEVAISYIPEVLVKMRAGGISNNGLSSRIYTLLEDYKAWRQNGLKRGQGIKAQILKRFNKLDQFIP